jgi:deoxyribose-phosphate aldolase
MDKTINRYLDAAVLYPEMARKDAREAIKTIINYQCRTACVRPCDIDIALEQSQGTQTEVCVVLGFPHGCGLSEVKALEAKAYIDKGVHEIDMVVNYGFIRSHEWDLVENDIRSVSEVTRPAGVILKVILETSELSLEQVARATEIAIKAQADFVKTSTGFASGSATREVVNTMMDTAKGRIKIKPSGGIRDYARAKMFVDMGADRLGIGYTSLAAICDGEPAATASTNKY